MDLATTSIPKKVHQGRTFGPYKGVRMRTWGKWVSEVRIPKTGERIWLVSYDAPEKAARACDAAQFCIHGEQGCFNFPPDKRPVFPQGFMVSLSKKDIQEIAKSFVASLSASYSSLASSAMPEVPSESDNSAPSNVVVCSGVDDAYESIGDSLAPTSIMGTKFRIGRFPHAGHRMA